MVEIFVEDQKLDLLPNEVIESTHQINDIAELSDQQITFTNSFKVPITKNNDSILGYSSSTTTDSEDAFKKLTTHVFRNGVPIIPKAQTIIEKVAGFYELTIYSGAWKFFDATRRKFLSTLNLLDASAGNNFFTWNRVTCRDKSELVGNEAKFLQFSVVENGETPLTGNVIDAREMYMLYSVQTIIDAILADEGVTTAGNLFTDDIYKRLAIPFSNKVYESAEDAAGEAFVVSVVDFFSGFLAEATVLWDTIDSGNDNGDYDPATGKFTATVAHTGIFATSGQLNATGGSTVRIKSSIAGVLESGIFTTSSYSLQTDPISIAIGEEITVTVEHSSIFGGLLTGIFSNVPDVTTIFTNKVRIAENLPNISRANMLKTVFQMFGAIVEFDPLSQTLTANKFSILTDNINIAVDWSSKFDASIEPQIEFRRDYAQENFMNYRADNVVTDGLGDGSFIVEDDTLVAEKVEFTLQFAASEAITILDNIKCAIVPILKDDGVGGLELGALVQPRMLLMVQGIGQSLDITDGSSTDTMLDGDWSRAVFIDDGESIAFGGTLGLINTKYPSLVNSIDKGRRVIMNFRLTEEDIEALDFFVPRYLDITFKKRAFNGYFYVSKADGFRGKEQSTTVTLIQI